MALVRYIAPVLVGVLTAAPHDLLAQEPTPTGAFITRLGADTTAVERFTRTGDTYSVEQVLRSPRTSLRHTHLELTPSGDIATVFLMHHRIGAPMDAPLLASTKLSFPNGDSATVETLRGDTTATKKVAGRAGMIPSLPQSFLPYELAAMRLRAARSDSTGVVLLSPGGDSMPVIVRRLGADSMTFTLPFLTYRARVDSEGRILSLYVPRGASVQRHAAVDVNGIAKAWAALDAGGKAMGPLSPLDSASALVGDARVSVRYSRPKKRGRVIFGNIVPWDTVWRTGANAATVLATDRDLVVGKTVVPAGRYTLFTVPSRSGTRLVINKETMRDGEPLAGTDYDASNDLARVAMRTRTLAPPVEQFTVEITPRARDQGMLRLAWDRREMTVPFRVRRTGR